MHTMSEGAAPHAALPLDHEELGPADLDERVRQSELVDVVEDSVITAVSEAVDEATATMNARGTTSRSASAAVRSPVDLEVVIPAYNELGRLPATLAAMIAFLSDQPWASRVVVVDNGSVDDTAAAVLSVAGGAVEAVVVGCSRPGKGAAVQRGLRTSRSRFVGFTDADLSTPLETMLPAIAALEGGAAAAIASRYAPGAHLAVRQPLSRRLGGRAFRALSRPLLPGVHDTQCGFKFFDRVAVQAALWRCRSTGFAFDVELLRHVRDDGGRIVEVPVTWTDTSGSSLRPVRDGVAAFSAVTTLHRDLARRAREPQRRSSPPLVRPQTAWSAR